jgi:hypothetical protein
MVEGAQAAARVASANMVTAPAALLELLRIIFMCIRGAICTVYCTWLLNLPACLPAPALLHGYLHFQPTACSFEFFAGDDVFLGVAAKK